jgi:hypothetical protein
MKEEEFYTEEEFYRETDPLWCQGDIIREIPHIHLRPPLPLTVVRKEQVKWGLRLAPYPYDSSASQVETPESASPAGGFKFIQGEQILAFCQIAFGMILSYDCEMEKDATHRMVALIRPLSPVPPEGQKIMLYTCLWQDNGRKLCGLPAINNTSPRFHKRYNARCFFN